MTLSDDGVAIYKERMRLAVRRSYAVQVAACVSGALIAWRAALSALDGPYGQSVICTTMLVLACVKFSAPPAREHAPATRLTCSCNDAAAARGQPFGARPVLAGPKALPATVT